MSFPKKYPEKKLFSLDDDWCSRRFSPLSTTKPRFRLWPLVSSWIIMKKLVALWKILKVNDSSWTVHLHKLPLSRDSGQRSDLKGTSFVWTKHLSGHHSPELNPRGFLFFWGISKTVFLREKPLTVQDMKNNIIWYSRKIWSASLLTSHQWIQDKNVISLCSETWSPSWACYSNSFYINLFFMLFCIIFILSLIFFIVPLLCQMC